MLAIRIVNARKCKRLPSDSSASSVEFIQNDFDMETRGKKKAGVKSMPCIE